MSADTRETVVARLREELERNSRWLEPRRTGEVMADVLEYLTEQEGWQ